jgi:hypothetical protein
VTCQPSFSETQGVTSPWNKTSYANESAVKEFFDSDDICWTSPNLRDCVKIPGTQERRSRKYLTCTLKEAHSIFTEKRPEIKCSYSKFSSLRPPHIRLQSQLPEVTCLCRYHENFNSLVKALRPVLPPEVGSAKEFLKKVVCHVEKEECMLESCRECCDKFQVFCDQLLGDLDEIAPAFYIWETSGERKVRIEDFTFNDILKKVVADIGAFKKHCFIKWAQSTAFQVDRNHIEPSTCIIQVDFAENYKCDVQDEIQAHHFKGGKQVTIFTAYTWWNENQQAIVGVSDSLEHSKYTVYLLIEKILSHVKLHSVKDYHFYR